MIKRRKKMSLKTNTIMCAETYVGEERQEEFVALYVL